MLKKNKKNLLLAGGLLGALIASSVAGIALSSCTTTSTVRPTDTETEYTKTINWEDSSSLTGLIKDSQGLVYSDESKTNVIALDPNSKATTITLPSTVTTISGYVKVTGTGDSQKSVQTGAFQDNTSLITITVSSGIRLNTIDKLAFSGCTSLTSISDTSSVTKIGNSAFSGCTKLQPFSLSKVQSIGASAFKGCTAFNGAVDLSNVSTIGDSTFYGTGITTVDASKNSWLTSIGANAFNGCTSLTTVTLPSENINNLTTIGGSAFSGCTSLKTVAPSGQTGFYATSKITAIGSTAFKDTLIESIDFSTTSITNSNYELNTSFNNMSMVTSIKLPNTLINIGQKMFNNCGDKGTGFDLVLPSSITNFRVESKSSGEMAFAPFANSGLKSIDMSNITSYDNSANSANIVNKGQFWNATKLETVILKPGTTTIKQYAFQNCSNLKVVKEASQSYDSGYVATSSITSIGDNAFSNAFAANSNATIDLSATSLKTVPTGFTSGNISSVKLPSTITTVGANTFFGNSNLTSLTIGASGISSSSALFTGSGITANTDKTANPSTYKAANLPFGSNSKLTALYYDSFTSTGTSTTTSAQALFETTSKDTWEEAAMIINSLSNYDYDTSGVGSDGASIPANLSAWTAVTTGATRTTTIIEDATITSTNAASGKLASIAFNKCFSTANDTIGHITISSTLASNTFIHNGITWTYKNDGNSITLTGVANMYKTTVTSNNTSSSFLTFFNSQQAQFTPSGGTATTYNIPSLNKVAVTLTIATKAAA